MRRMRLGLALAMYFVASVCAAQVTQDRVRVQNGGSEQKGVLVDGNRQGGHVNDAAYLSPQLGGFFSGLFPYVTLDNFSPSTQSNEIIAFAPGHPPTAWPQVGWTAAANIVDVALEDAYRIPVHVWIVARPFDAHRELAVEHSVVTSRLWDQERLGLVFERFVVRDATHVTGYPVVECPDAPALRAAVGAEPGAINVYYVDQVLIDGVNTRTGAWFCSSGYTILMSSQTSGELLAHELGHAFDLEHVDTNVEWFDTTNIMHSRSDDRQYLTEGQTFRAVHNPASALNNLYDVRAGRGARDCPHSTTTNACPAVYRRIWAEGRWARN